MKSIIPIVSILILGTLDTFIFNTSSAENKQNRSSKDEDPIANPTIYFEKANPDIPSEYIENINKFIEECPPEKSIMIKSYCALENNDKCKKALAQQRISRVIKFINQRNSNINTISRIFLEGGAIQIRNGQISTEKITLFYK